MKKKQRFLKPRNPHLVQMVKRKSGAHIKSSKALRRGEKSRKLLDSE